MERIFLLKIIIFEASRPMRETILTLAETKSRISFLKEINTHEGKGKQAGDYGYNRLDPEIEYLVAFDVV